LPRSTSSLEPTSSPGGPTSLVLANFSSTAVAVPDEALRDGFGSRLVIANYPDALTTLQRSVRLRAWEAVVMVRE
jgi:hypothetical protein